MNPHYKKNMDTIFITYSIKYWDKVNMIIHKKICGLLNRRGGVILFDCKAVHLEVHVSPLLILEKEKERIV